jgi:hypothetical protein
MVDSLPIVILSVGRKVNYIQRVIQSLKDTGYMDQHVMSPPRIVVGNSDSSHLDELIRSGMDIIVDSMGEEEAADLHLTKLSNQQKCGLGHYRWMKVIATLVEKPEFILACEDDVVFARGWQRYISSVLEDVWATLGRNAIVSLYRLHQEGITHDRAKERFMEGRKWYPIQEHFWGTQAIVYPVCILNDLAEFVLENNVHIFRNPIDMLIGEYAWGRNIPLVATTPSLVQHIGEATTGQSTYFHRAGFFMESVELYV